MKWLFWKEYRQNLPILITALALLIVPYFFGLYLFCRWHLANPDGMVKYDIFLVAVIYSVALSQLAVTLIGGNAIAGERVDRSAEFQAYLPLARRRIISAKIFLALAVAAVIWVPNLLLAFFISDNQTRHDLDFFYRIIINVAVTGLAMFGVAWLCSATIKSPTIATFVGLITPLVFWSVIYYIAYLEHQNQMRWPPKTVDLIMEYTYRGLCLATGPLSFGIGTWLYLRRIEP